MAKTYFGRYFSQFHPSPLNVGRSVENKLTLRSGRRVVAEGNIDGMVETIKKLQEVRNTDSVWKDIETPWKVLESVLSQAPLIRWVDPLDGDEEYIDPFATLSVYDGKKKLISVWK